MIWNISQMYRVIENDPYAFAIWIFFNYHNDCFFLSQIIIKKHYRISRESDDPDEQFNCWVKLEL